MQVSKDVLLSVQDLPRAYREEEEIYGGIPSGSSSKFLGLASSKTGDCSTACNSSGIFGAMKSCQGLTVPISKAMGREVSKTER